MRKVSFLIVLLLFAGFSFAQVNSSTFGMLEARQMGPGTMSGRITAIEGVNQEEGKTFYMGTAGGGIWKTTNAGVYFQAHF